MKTSMYKKILVGICVIASIVVFFFLFKTTEQDPENVITELAEQYDLEEVYETHTSALSYNYNLDNFDALKAYFEERKYELTFFQLNQSEGLYMYTKNNLLCRVSVKYFEGTEITQSQYATEVSCTDK